MNFAIVAVVGIVFVFSYSIVDRALNHRERIEKIRNENNQVYIEAETPDPAVDYRDTNAN